MSNQQGWCEECQELNLIKARCEDYRLQTIELKRKLKEANVRIDLLERTNKANVVAAKEDVRKLKKLADDQRAIIDNFRLMLKVASIR